MVMMDSVCNVLQDVKLVQILKSAKVVLVICCYQDLIVLKVVQQANLINKVFVQNVEMDVKNVVR